MKKYLQVMKNTWNEAVAYRVSFVLYRVREVTGLLTMYFLWLVVLPNNGQLFGYTQSIMLTYILGTALLSDLIFATRSSNIASEINEGMLSNFLLRPINYLGYYFARDIGDKAMNVVFSIGELSLIILLLHPPLFVQTNAVFILLTIATSAVSLLLYFFFGVVFGFLGFWSNETWGPRFIFYQLLIFFAGGLFPLDILPKPLFSVIEYLPFTYLLYFPMKIYLGHISLFAIYKGIAISLLWLLIMYIVVQRLWMRGLRSYTAQGR